MKGGLHPTKNTLVRPIFLHIDDSVELIDLFSTAGRGTFREI